MPVERRLPALLLSALLAGCGGGALVLPGGGSDGAPRLVRVDPMTLPEPVPRQEPPAAVGNHSPYTVFGRSYSVLDTAVGYRAVGTASWYGRKFHGRPTSSGEPFDMFAFTAAHRSLPLPCWVRVTNTVNGRSLVVRVNDRGPFVGDRVMDLSWAAAVRLGFVDQGTAPVQIEVLTPWQDPAERLADSAEWQPEVLALPDAPPDPRPDAPPAAVAVLAPQPEAAPAAPAQLHPGAASGIWFLQAGAFSDRVAAERLQAELVGLTGTAVLVEAHPSVALHRVRVGPLASQAEADRLQALIITADLGIPLVVHEPSSVPAPCRPGPDGAAC